MSGEKLYRLTRDGRRLVTEDFLRGETNELSDDTGNVIEPEPTGVEVDLETLADQVQAVIEEYDRYSTGMDAALAPDVHRCIDVSRRIAADDGVWHWLATIQFPEFVRYRWEYTTEEAMREKFLGAGVDIFSNAIHRLWWIAELTHDGDDYSLTRDILGNQTVANKIFDRWFARYQPAAVVCCEELAEEPTSLGETVTYELNLALSNCQLESMEKSDLRSVVREIREAARGETA